MTHLSSLARFAAATGLALALASACGGKSSDGGDEGRAGTNVGGSTTAQAGSRNIAGKTTHAGGSAGVTGGTAGTGSGGGVTAGASGYAGEACSAPPDPGRCEAYFRSWYHDPSTGICRPFVYGGCDGNANRYTSLEECQKACAGGTPNFDACTQASDCVIAGSTGCCAACDGPDISKHDLIAYNWKHINALRCNVALKAAPPPGESDVPACAPCPPVEGGRLKYFVPNCVQNQCVVEDLIELGLAACETSEDCGLRFGTGCCQSCSSSDVISLRKDANLEKLLCDGLPLRCDDCAQPVTSAQPHCSAEGRCEVVVPL